MSLAGRYILAPVRSLNAQILKVFVVEPSSGSSLGYVDGLRAIAVLMVVALHVLGWASARLLIPLPLLPPLDVTPIASHGGFGVQLFYVISGFLLAQPWLRACYLGKTRPNVRTYFKLRLFRIVPAYYTCIFLTLLFYTGVYIPAQFVYSRDGLFTVVAHLLFLQFIFPLSSTSFNFNSPLWTLTMEMIFYVTLPVTVRFFSHKRWMIALPASMLISVGWLHACRTVLQPLVQQIYLAMHQDPNMSGSFTQVSAVRFLTWQFPAQWVLFGFGITAANLYIWYGLHRPQRGLFAALTSPLAGVTYCVFGWIIFLSMEYPGPVLSFLGPTQVAQDHLDVFAWGYYITKPVLGLAFFLVVVGLGIGTSWLRAIFSVTPLRLVGIVSYSIYLWHAPLIRNWVSFQPLKTLPLAEHYQVLLLITSASVFFFACFSYLAVEKPFMLMARRQARAQREKAAAKEQAQAAARAREEEGVPSPAGSGAAVPAFAAVSERGP